MKPPEKSGGLFQNMKNTLLNNFPKLKPKDEPKKSQKSIIQKLQNDEPKK